MAIIDGKGDCGKDSILDIIMTLKKDRKVYVVIWLFIQDAPLPAAEELQESMFRLDDCFRLNLSGAPETVRRALCGAGSSRHQGIDTRRDFTRKLTFILPAHILGPNSYIIAVTAFYRCI